MAEINLNSLNQQALKMGLKPLSPAQVKNMTPQQIKGYLKAGRQVTRTNRRNFRKVGRTLRQNAKAEMSEQLKALKVKHNTIRQGMAQVSALGAEIIGSTAPQTSAAEKLDAVSQNINGGTMSNQTNGTTTEKGIVNKQKSYDSRDEE